MIRRRLLAGRWTCPPGMRRGATDQSIIISIASGENAIVSTAAMAACPLPRRRAPLQPRDGDLLLMQGNLERGRDGACLRRARVCQRAPAQSGAHRLRLAALWPWSMSRS